MPTKIANFLVILAAIVTISLFTLYIYSPTKFQLSTFAWNRKIPYRHAFVVPESKFARTSKHRWLRLQDRYPQLNIDSLWTKSQNYEGRRLIYKCKSFCGGFGDRVRGIISCFILALVSNRQFMIDMTHPTDLRRFLSPNLYNWSFYDAPSIANRSRLVISSLDYEPRFPAQIRNTSFVDAWLKYDDIEIYTNIDLVSDIFRNNLVRTNEFLRTFLSHVPLQQLTLHHLLPLMFETLFRPVPAVIDAIEPVLEAIQNGYLLTCLHVRMGRNPSNPLDEAFRDRSTASDDIIEFLNSTNIEQKRNTKIFVASDSDRAVSRVVDRFGNQVITVPGPIVHVDRPAKNVNITQGFLKVVIEFYMFGECHVSVLTSSGFSALANRRRIEPYRNLYEYDGSKRRVERCHDIFDYSSPPKVVRVGSYCRVVYNCSARDI